jgi:hypothetical protein
VRSNLLYKVALLASVAVSLSFGQGMLLEWQVPGDAGTFSYPVIGQTPNSVPYRDSSLYDYDKDGIIDLIETVQATDSIGGFLGDSIKVFAGGTHLLRFDTYVPGGHVFNPCFIEMDADSIKELFCIVKNSANTDFSPTWFDIVHKNIKYQIGPFQDFKNWGFEDIDNDNFSELLCQVQVSSGLLYFEVWGFSPLEVKPSPLSFSNAAGPKLFPSTPNPFRTLAKIEYFIPDQNRVLLAIFNAKGSMIRMLVNAQQNKGSYGVVWDGKTDNGTTAPSGTYFYKLSLGSTMVINRQMVFVK